MTASPTLKLFKTAVIPLLLLLSACSDNPKEMKEDAAKYFQQAADYYQRGYYESAKDLFLEVIEIEEELKLFDRTGDCLLYIGLIDYGYADYSSSMKYNERASEYFKQRFNRRSEGIAVNNIGNIYSQLGRFSLALDTYRKALSISQFSADKEGEAVAQLNIGSVFGSMGNYQTAFEYYSKGFENYEIIGDLQGKAVASNKIGEAYLRFGSLSDALSSFEYALETAENGGMQNMIPSIMNNIALTYFSLGDYNAALNALEYGRKNLLVDEDPATGWIIENNAGDCYQMLYQYDNALKSYKDAVSISDKYGEGLNSAFIKLKIASINFLNAAAAGKEFLPVEAEFIELADYFDEAGFAPGKLNALTGAALVSSYANKTDDGFEYIKEAESMLGSTELNIANRLTEYYCIQPGIASQSNIFIPYLQAGKYNELISFASLINLRRELEFTAALNEFKPGSAEKNQEAKRLKELSSEYKFLLFETADERSKTNGYGNSDKLENLIERLEDLNISGPDPFETFLIKEYNFSSYTTEEIRHKLTPDELLLCFFSGKDNITAVGLSKNDLFAEKINLNEESLKHQVNSVISKIEKNDTSDVKLILQGMYHRLVRPLDNKLSQYNEIIVVPYFRDAALQYLPFHSLINEKGTFLSELKSISYFAGLSQKAAAEKVGAVFVGQSGDFRNMRSVTPSHSAKETLISLTPVQLNLDAPVYFSMKQPSSSYIELHGDTVQNPRYNLAFGELSLLKASTLIINNFYTDRFSSLKLMPQFFPYSERVVISHYNIPAGYKKDFMESAVDTENDIYRILNKNSLYWMSYFNYVKI